MGEVHVQMVGASFPWGAFGAWDLAFPLEHVGGAIRLSHWLGDKPERVICPPLLALFLEPSDD